MGSESPEGAASRVGSGLLLAQFAVVPLQTRVFEAVRKHARLGMLPAAAEHAGLPRVEFHELCERLGLAGAIAVPESPAAPDLLAPLVELLWRSRSADGPWTRLMAGLLGSAAFGARHLWQDLGTEGRHEVSALLQQQFQPLFVRNVLNVKWKKHFFECLGADIGRRDLRPPRCDGCDEYAKCFPQPDVAATAKTIPLTAGPST